MFIIYIISLGSAATAGMLLTLRLWKQRREASEQRVALATARSRRSRR
jgi:hypothetical protein